jgi:hypothetical protein
MGEPRCEFANLLGPYRVYAPQGPNLECLTGIHRCQAFAIPYENLDIQLGRYLDRDRSRIFEKLVSQRRGGWCYEAVIQELQPSADSRLHPSKHR